MGVRSGTIINAVLFHVAAYSSIHHPQETAMNRKYVHATCDGRVCRSEGEVTTTSIYGDGRVIFEVRGGNIH